MWGAGIDMAVSLSSVDTSSVRLPQGLGKGRWTDSSSADRLIGGHRPETIVAAATATR
jgi:hypothetical protein